jgi:omega-amidase
MSFLAPTPRLAIAQIAMHWEMCENIHAMKKALRVAHAEGATICAFSELAVTGFHRRIVEWAKPEASEPAVDELRAEAATLGVAAAFGAPTYRHDGARFNSHLFISADGSLAGTVNKIGLTEPEATFFTPGISRPTVCLAGVKCSAVICREIEDATQILPQLQHTGVEVIFWPGQMRPDPDKPVKDPPEHVVQAQGLARQAGAYVVQTNWPNALNRPEESENTGHSACIAPTGEILFRLPKQGHGVGVFNLGERAFHWHPSGV